MSQTFKGLWPEVDTLEKARAACRTGGGFGLFVAGMTALFAALGTAGVEFAVELGMDAWAFGEAGMFALLSWGMFKCSRVAAVLAALLFFVERIVMAFSGVSGGTIMAFFILLAFVGAARGAFALHRMREAHAGVQPVNPGDAT